MTTSLITRANAAQAYADAAKAAPGSKEARAHKAAASFESVLVNNLLGSMFHGIEGEGPMGINGPGGDAWRGMLVEQIAGTVVKGGGLGLAPQVYRELIRVQEQK